MEPPNIPHGKRRASSNQSSTAQKFISDVSPSPFSSSTELLQHSVETRRPRPSQTVSLGWEDEDDTIRHTSRVKVELADCIETKTVTTTTTTKRSYPPLLFQSPRPLDSLNSKEYPLALKPTPPELARFSYEVDGKRMEFEEDDLQNIMLEGAQNRTARNACSRHQSREGYEHFGGELDKLETQILGRSSKQEGINNLWKSSKGKGLSGSRSSSSLSGKSLRDSYHENRRRSLGLGMSLSKLPATPDTSEVESSSKEFSRPPTSRLFSSTYTPQSGLSQADSFADATSPSEAVNRETFNSAVATPPIAESDLEPSELQDTDFSHGQPPPLNTAVARNASLPSPGLSPAFSSADLETDVFAGPEFDDDDGTTQSGDSQEGTEDYPLRVPKTRALKTSQRQFGSPALESQFSTIMEIGSMLDTFDVMPNEMKSLVMYQLSRRCSKKTLRAVVNFVNPALMCDFLNELPIELSFHILSYLDHKDLCHATQVSKRWRNVIDSNETGWKELFDHDGFVLQPGELERAIHQGWAWQDPHGPDGYEMDLSVKEIPKTIDPDLIVASSSRTDATRKARPSIKRKRPTVNTGSERSKRRVVSHEFSSRAQEIVARYPSASASGYHKSEGPLSAANAAAMAVPDPQLGLPELRKLHLFKSLYRRHYALRHSWTNRAVNPHHMAFKAHPAHVITCLQFDDEKILTGSDDTCIHVYDTKTGALRKKLEGHDGGVWALQYEGNTLVSGSTDRSVRVWDIEKGLCTQVFHGHTSTVRCLQILMPSEAGKTSSGKSIMVPEKPLIITGSRDSHLRVWRLPEQGDKRYIQTGPPANDADCPYFVRVLAGHTHSVRAIAAHQDTLVSGSYDSSVRVWRISTGEVLHRLQGHNAKVYSVVLDHKRNRCISGSMDTFVKVWSLETGACLFTLEGHTSLVGLLDLRDERLVSAAADSTLRIWDPETGVCKSTLSAHTGAITCFQHDGQKVISGSDRTLKMWNVKTGECVKDLLTDLTGVWQVKFDERRCVAAVQRDNFTYVEVLDFGASRDGVPASERGHRILLPGTGESGPSERIVAVDDDAAA